MCNNKNLLKAKKEANDEFYTCEDDVKRELRNYDLHGLSVYCNCDDWRSSKFFHYLKKNFQTLGLRHLIATGFNECGRGYYASYDGKELVTRELTGNGDCFSEECTALLKEADIVITNPPFSLFKQYVKLLMDFRMKFIIVGTESGCTYKDVFPYVMAGKMWVGCNMIKKFRLPDGSIKKFGNICWYTNVISNGSRMRLNESGRSYSNEYRKYDNYDAIEINSVKDIPFDYYGVMGVPVSYLKYLDPMLFEIVGVSSSSRENAGKYFLGGNCTRPILDGKKKFTRLFIKRIRHELLVS
jgi:hypothetical protein